MYETEGNIMDVSRTTLIVILFSAALVVATIYIYYTAYMVKAGKFVIKFTAEGTAVSGSVASYGFGEVSKAAINQTLQTLGYGGWAYTGANATNSTNATVP